MTLNSKNIMKNKNLQKITHDLPSIFTSFDLLPHSHRIHAMKTVTAILETKRNINRELVKLQAILDREIY